MDTLTVAVPTGRLFNDAIELLRRLEILTDAPRERNLVIFGQNGMRVLISSPGDLLTYVEHGAADAGIVGKDMVLEQERDVYELVDLGFGACRGVIALPEDQAQHRWRPGVLLRIATKYPKVTARFFEREKRPVEIIALHGSVELAPRAGLADGIMDLVMTGRTLRDNLLAEIVEVFRSSARLVVNRVSLRTRSSVLRPLLDQVESAVQEPIG
jgi:ATP phosphoribosyltransferase